MIWKIIAWILSRPLVANWLITHAQKSPYTHIYKNGKPYMERYWLFNPYYVGQRDQERSKYPWFPWNMRLHWIRQADQDKDMHDHPWNARTIILKGGYVECRQFGMQIYDKTGKLIQGDTKVFTRPAGATCKIGYGMYHKITHIQAGGAWTLFISGPYQGTWGFLVDGVKVQWRKYLGLEK
jgi:hypothetical protein